MAATRNENGRKTVPPSFAILNESSRSVRTVTSRTPSSIRVFTSHWGLLTELMGSPSAILSMIEGSTPSIWACSFTLPMPRSESRIAYSSSWRNR